MKNILYIIFILIILAVILGPFVIPYNPFEMNLKEILTSPSKSHIFGTDNMGRDIFSRVIYGGRVSLGIGFLATITSVLFGVLIGLIAGYKGGLWDKILSVLIDITLSFPSLLLAIGIVVVLPPGLWSVVLALTLAGWAGFARFVRGIVLGLKHADYVKAADVLGLGSWGIMTRHILPNCMPFIVVTGFLNLGTFILSEASLSFLGLGVPPPNPTWGGMINYGREFIQIAPWIVVFPGLALAVTVIICNLLGDKIRDSLDPRCKLSNKA